MDKKTDEIVEERREIKIKYKTVMKIIIAIEVLIICATIIYGILK